MRWGETTLLTRSLLVPAQPLRPDGSWDKIKQGMTAFYDSTLATIPLGRMGSAEEVAAQAALLISPLGGFTTGTNVVIDGGMTKRIQY